MKRRTFICTALHSGLGAAAVSTLACRKPEDDTAFKPGPKSQEVWALDLDVQELARRSIADAVIEQVSKRKLPADTDLAFILLDNETGGVIAYIGNRGDSQYDFGQTRRNSGSIIKPLYYAIALDSGAVSMDASFIDARQSYRCDSCKGGIYSPRNYGDRYRDAPVPLITALALSINTVAMQVFQRIEPATIRRKLELLGLPPYTNALTAALGWEISPLNLCAAFTAFSSETGGAISPRFALEKKVNGIPMSMPPRCTERVFHPNVVQFITQAMRACLTTGTGSAAARLADRLVGKTGSSSDSWALLFGRRITSLLWVGRQESTYDIGFTGGRLSMPLLAGFMQNLKSARPDLLPRWSNQL